MPRRRNSAAAVVFALLVIATVAAFAYAQRLKRDPLVIDRVEFGHGKEHTFVPSGFSASGHCATHPLRIKFRTTTSNDATIQVLAQPGGEVVRTLAHERFLKRYSYHLLHWDGVTGAGKLAPAGRYRLRVLLEDEGRTLNLPGTIRLHESKVQPPGVRCFHRVDGAGKGPSS